jgi:hypothetical protein
MLSEMELEVLPEWLKDILQNRKIRPSKSPATALILFIPKEHGRSLCLCMDSRGIKEIIISKRDPLPIISDL